QRQLITSRALGTLHQSLDIFGGVSSLTCIKIRIVSAPHLRLQLVNSVRQRHKQEIRRHLGFNPNYIVAAAAAAAAPKPPAAPIAPSPSTLRSTWSSHVSSEGPWSNPR